ncbi:hypothetical protein BR63_19070 [Thermanaerosceptrum fracticalcis]|uniref:DNA (cytosine-5-)-methyltransferase n=1 Tax=Thermanaerosceptrum fracticalcis TaxID=1712410 RepID=A0A7G6E7Y1_THEFR|nr:hypothetical protein [Thermanaerosceptrum fracticalcis]QNB48185.1 hypothetical protein BR63_19070 [Thermanaerosceptrum fracticalcis]
MSINIKKANSYFSRVQKSKQIARCGNAVSPPFAEALVRANLPELCEIGNAEQVI